MGFTIAMPAMKQCMKEGRGWLLRPERMPFFPEAVHPKTNLLEPKPYVTAKGGGAPHGRNIIAIIAVLWLKPACTVLK